MVLSQLYAYDMHDCFEPKFEAIQHAPTMPLEVEVSKTSSVSQHQPQAL